MAGMGMGMLGGMFGGGAGPNPYAGMNPYGGMTGFDPNNFMSQLGQGTPQAPTGAWATNPASAPPWAQAAMAGPGGMQGYLQNQRSQQLAGKTGLPPNILAMLQSANQPGQGMDPRMMAMQAAVGQQGQMPQGMPGPYGGILSGLMGGQGWGQQPRQQMPQQRPPARQPAPARPPRRASYGGGSAGNISLSGY